MDIVTKKFKNLLRICMENKISLDTIQQIIALRDMKNSEEIADRLLQKIDKMNETELKKEIEMIIEK